MLYVGISSGISGTVAAANMAAQQLMEEYPQRQVVVVDSMGAGLGTGILACKAADYSIAGMDIRAAEEQLNIDRLGLCEYFTVDDLMFLRRSGRVSGVTAVLGSMLQIKPMLLVGMKREKSWSAAKFAAESAPSPSWRRCMPRRWWMPSISGLPSPTATVWRRHSFWRRESARFAPKELILSMHEPLTGAHVGPGMLAVFFFGDGR